MLCHGNNTTVYVELTSSPEYGLLYSNHVSLDLCPCFMVVSATFVKILVPSRHAAGACQSASLPSSFQHITGHAQV